MKLLRRLSYAALAFGFLHIVFGAIVRISGSGLGCGDHWPKCHGWWIPPLRRMDLIIEVSHRYLAAGLSTTVLLLLAGALLRRREPGVPGRGGVLRPAVLATVLVFSAALLGAVVVKLELHNKYIIVLHLAIAMSLLATLAVATVRAGGLGSLAALPGGATSKTFRSARSAAGLAFIAVAFGGLTANVVGANGACQGFPTCSAGVLTSGTPLYVHVVHRVLAFLLLFHTLGIAIAVVRRGESLLIQRAARIVFGTVILQIVVAALLVELHLPAPLRSLHEAVGTLVWLTAFVFATLARRASVDGDPALLEPVRSPSPERPFGRPVTAIATVAPPAFASTSMRSSVAAIGATSAETASEVTMAAANVDSTVVESRPSGWYADSFADSFAEEPVFAKSHVDASVVVQPLFAESVAEQPSIDESVVDESVVDESVVQDPLFTASIADQPLIDDSVDAEPVFAGSVVEESVVTEPLLAESIAEPPSIDASVVDASVVDDSAVDELVVPEPRFAESIAEQPFVDDSVDAAEIVTAEEAPVAIEPHHEPTRLEPRPAPFTVDAMLAEPAIEPVIEMTAPDEAEHSALAPFVLESESDVEPTQGAGDDTVEQVPPWASVPFVVDQTVDEALAEAVDEDEGALPDEGVLIARGETTAPSRAYSALLEPPSLEEIDADEALHDAPWLAAAFEVDVERFDDEPRVEALVLRPIAPAAQVAGRAVPARTSAPVVAEPVATVATVADAAARRFKRPPTLAVLIARGADF